MWQHKGNNREGLPWWLLEFQELTAQGDLCHWMNWFVEVKRNVFTYFGFLFVLGESSAWGFSRFSISGVSSGVAHQWDWDPRQTCSVWHQQIPLSLYVHRPTTPVACQHGKQFLKPSSLDVRHISPLVGVLHRCFDIDIQTNSHAYIYIYRLCPDKKGPPLNNMKINSKPSSIFIILIPF